MEKDFFGNRLLVADDHPLFRYAVIEQLKSNFQFNEVFEAENGIQATEVCERLMPELVILDSKMPVMNGIEASIAIRKFNATCKILIFIEDNNSAFIKESMQCGVNGILVKECEPTELFHAITHINNCKTYYSQAVYEKWTEHLIGNVDGDERKHLNKREYEVLRLICQGLSAQEISDALFISIYTVNNHKARIFQKTNCRSVGQLVHYSLVNSIIQL